MSLMIVYVNNTGGQCTQTIPADVVTALGLESGMLVTQHTFRAVWPEGHQTYLHARINGHPLWVRAEKVHGEDVIARYT